MRVFPNANPYQIPILKIPKNHYQIPIIKIPRKSLSNPSKIRLAPLESAGSPSIRREVNSSAAALRVLLLLQRLPRSVLRRKRRSLPRGPVAGSGSIVAG